MKLYFRLIFLTLCVYIFIKLLKKDATVHPAHGNYVRHSNGINRIPGTPDGKESSIHVEHLSSSLAEQNYREREVIETLPLNQTSRLFGIDAGELVKVSGRNGSVDVEQRIGNKYCLIKKLGEGHYGEVYLATDINTSTSVAIKLENTRTTLPCLQLEEKVYRTLEGEEGFPSVRWSGRDGHYNIMATDLLGLSLGKYFFLCNQRFSLHTTLIIADQLIRRLQYVHSKGFLHRDVRPENFLVGLGEKRDIIHTVDFGLAKQYRSHDNKHIPYRENAEIIGTADYASDNKLRGIQQSRRDDMESIGYMLIYFLRGPLPWQNLRLPNKDERCAKILSIRKSVSIDNLCKRFPQEFAIYLKKCRSLKFDKEPDYYNLRLLFRNLSQRLNLTSDIMFDWQVANGRCEPLL